jgi:hypothetical protein
MTQIRIGDAERDSAAAALGEHYAAGRLTKDEYDERIDLVWSARYEGDLAPLFSDLPRKSALTTPTRGAVRTGGNQLASYGRRSSPPPGFHPLMLLGPIAVAAIIVTAVATGHAPWLFLLFFLWCFGGMGGRRRRQHWAHSR